MTATAWLAVSIAATGVVVSLLLALVVSGLRTLRAELKNEFTKLDAKVDILAGKVDGLSTRIGLLETRVQAVEVVLMKPPNTAEVG